MKLDLYLLSLRKISSKWIKDLSEKRKEIKINEMQADNLEK